MIGSLKRHARVTLCNTFLVAPLLQCAGRVQRQPAGAYFWGAFGPGVLSLVQLVPALHQFNNHGLAEVHQLKPSHIGPAMHKPLQRYVFKALRTTGKEERKNSKSQNRNPNAMST